jgi:hypothetical protein
MMLETMVVLTAGPTVRDFDTAISTPQWTRGPLSTRFNVDRRSLYMSDEAIPAPDC